MVHDVAPGKKRKNATAAIVRSVQYEQDET
jgi:hypothetical protein